VKPDIKGLLKLGRFLKRLPKQNFNQGYWWEEVKGETKESCGTTGCVAGWAATIFPHRFQKIVHDTVTTDDGTMSLYEVRHRSSQLEGADAFAQGFKIPYDEAHRITMAGAHRNSPKVAANAIFSLVNRLKKAAKKA
jgi:hypothetical protein